MKNILPWLTAILLLACSGKKEPTLFSSDMLAQQEFLVDPSKDTSFITLHGSVIKIAAGSFNVTDKVELEVREAFTPAEIFAAGMATESNGRPLRSGGMIYINAKARGEAVTLVKSLKVSIPNSYYDSAMQVFKGVETDSAGINWVDPAPMDSTPQSNNWAHGRYLFRSMCTSCHSIFRMGTGPALANVENRGPWTNRRNLYEFMRNTASYVNTNSYARNLKAQFGTVMTSFALPDKEIDAILDYIKNESKRPEALQDEINYGDSLTKAGEQYSPSDTLSFRRPCGNDTFYLPVKKPDSTFFDIANPNEQPTIDTTPPTPQKAKDREGLRGGFNDPNPTSGMYDFQIRTFGWFNVDAFVEGYDGTANVKLWAQAVVDFEIDLHIYLFCPEKKMLSIGYEREGNKYFFNKIDNGIPLFLDDRAILFAFGSKGDKMFYGITEFRIQKEQTVQIPIKETTDAAIRQALLSKQINGIDIGIEKKEQVIRENPCDDMTADTTKSK